MEVELRRRVLVVDDNAPVRRVLARELRSAFAVVEAESYAGAVALLAQHPDLCAVVCDCNLGEGPSGIDLMRHARRVAPELHRITVSGHVSEEDGRKLIAAGVTHAVIDKPWRTGAVRETIEALLSRAPSPALGTTPERDNDGPPHRTDTAKGLGSV